MTSIYLGLTGFLGMLGPRGAPPPPPLNLAGDYGGGALFLAMGVLAAMSNADRTGKGDVVDAAIVDGVASMLGVVHSLEAYGQWSANRHDNLLDGGAPFYRCYGTKDGKYMAVACIEPKFFAAMLDVLGIADTDYGGQYAKGSWPAQHRLLEATFSTKTREAWSTLFDGVDACVTPVLDFGEAAAPRTTRRARATNVLRASRTPMLPHASPRTRPEHLSELARVVPIRRPCWSPSASLSARSTRCPTSSLATLPPIALLISVVFRLIIESR